VANLHQVKYLVVLYSRVVDPDWIRIPVQWLCGFGFGLGIRIQGKKMKKYKYFFSWLYFFYNGKVQYKNSTNCEYLWLFVDFLIFEKICFLKYCCGSGSVSGSGLDPASMTLWIRIELNFLIRIRIRIRIESIRIHNPALQYCSVVEPKLPVFVLDPDPTQLHILLAVGLERTKKYIYLYRRWCATKREFTGYEYWPTNIHRGRFDFFCMHTGTGIPF
jgi:hypothetical protein